MQNNLTLNSTFLAKVISFIANPFLVLFIAIILGNFESIVIDPGPLLMFVIAGSFLPLIFYIYEILKHKKHPWDYVSLDRPARNPVYFVAILSFFFNIFVFAYLDLSFWTFQSVVIFIFFLIMFLINKYVDKVSMHTAAFSFAIIYLINSSSTYFVFFLLLLPLIFWSRIKLHKHTNFQLFLGTMIGLLIGLLTWLK